MLNTVKLKCGCPYCGCETFTYDGDMSISQRVYDRLRSTGSNVDAYTKTRDGYALPMYTCVGCNAGLSGAHIEVLNTL